VDQEAADELVGVEHDQTNALRLTEMDPAAERAAIRATIDRIEAASGTRPLGWLGAGLPKTWNMLDIISGKTVSVMSATVQVFGRRQ
jgi:hypothetical protein